MDFDPEDKAMLKDTIRLAKEAGKKVILLLNVAGPVELEAFMSDIDALVCLYFPGMEGARALADILFGQISPSGKLPITFPKTYRQTPTAINFPGEFGQVNYGEGIFVGYRYYDYKGIEPLYPFGFGLSYSTFSMRNASVSKTQYDNRSQEPLRVSVLVKNEGHMEAKEVVQLYIHCIKSKLQKPEQELKGFAKVSLLPGEETVVCLELLPKDFASYDTERKAWTAEPGEYEIRIGNSSRNIMAKTSVTVTGCNPYGCSLQAPIAMIAEHAHAILACESVFGDKFERSKLKSDVVYFGSTPLYVYLEKSIRGVDKASKEWETMLKRLEQRLEESEM